VATKYAIGNDASIVYDGDGTLPTPATSPGGPGAYKLPPSNTFTGDDWYLVAGAVLDFGAVRPIGANNLAIRKFGSGANPQILTSHASGSLNVATAYNVLAEDIEFIKVGAAGGTGFSAITCTNTGQPGITVRRCTFRNFTTGIDGDRCYTLVAEDNSIYGTTATTGIRGKAQLTCPVCQNWSLKRNTFVDVGVGIRLDMSDSANGAGSFAGLKIQGNVIRGCLTSGLLIGGFLNETNYGYRAALTVTGGPTYTIVRNAADPAWGGVTAGTVIFLAGWGVPTSFGRFQVVSGGGTRSLVITPLDGQVPVADAEGVGRGYFVMDADKCAVAPEIYGNDFDDCGQAPMQIINVIGGRVAENTITNTTVDDGNGGFGNTSACIEVQGSLRLVVEDNIIDGVTGPGTGDGFGVFLDGGADACIARRNKISNLVGSNVLSRSGVGVFYARNSKVYSNVLTNCMRASSVGGNSPGTQVFNNTMADSYYGWYVNSSPGANGNTITFQNNLLIGNDIGIEDNSTLTVNSNAYWQNVITNNVGGSPTVAPGSGNIYADPVVTTENAPMAGSPLLTGGADLGYIRDHRNAQVRGHVGAYGAAALRAA
jgi:hypothetical protein